MAPYAARSLLFCLYVSAGQCFSSSLSGGPFRGLNRPNSYSDFTSSTKHRSTRFAGAVATAENDTATFEVPAAETEIVVDADDFLKPERDLKDYRYIRLSNNLEVLLVSTAKATSSEEKSSAVEAASVHVQAGHMDDTIAGLAHFHEHMLFLGTEKYPDEDDYETFLSKFGGYANAYTDMEDTNYYFSVTSQQNNPNEVSEGLRGGLDRLSQFFISPLFEESMVERELRAVDSEYRNGKTNDSWRNYQFLKAISNQKHPFSKFGCGNYETLTSKGSPIPELKKFWETYYKTSNMRLTVMGRGSLDALQHAVEISFGELPYSNDAPRRRKENSNVDMFPRENAIYNPEEPAFGQKQLGKIRQIIPLLESRSLKVQFATPPMDDPVLSKTKPHRVLSHLIGHESPGSLYCLLNEHGLITGLSSGAALDTSDFSLFGITISLTTKGMQEKEFVLDLIFQWLALIKRTVIEQPELLAQYHDELRQISAMNFRFRESSNPTDFVCSAAELMFDNSPPSELLASGTIVDEYDPLVSKAFLDRLDPKNCMVTIVDSSIVKEEFEGWKVEPLYGATYREEEISGESMERWGDIDQETNPKLHLPALNGYIPTDFSLRCDDDNGPQISDLEREESRKTYPVLLQQGPNYRLWHKMDRYWRVPKTFIRLSIVSPKTYESPRAMTLSRIYQRVLNDDLNSFVYDASLAGCNYRISCAPSGYKVSVRGYSEKLPLLLDTLTSRMLSLIQEMKEGKDTHPSLFDKFEKAKESLLRETKNYRLDTPYEVCNYNSRLLMEEKVWYLDDYVSEMEGERAEQNPLTMQECAQIAEECLTGRLKLNCLCIGNIGKNEAEDVNNVIADHFLKPSRPLFESETPTFKSLQLPTEEENRAIFGPQAARMVKYQELAHSPSEENSAVEMTFQAGSDLSLGYEGIGILDLISQLAYNSAYNQLRTKEQLGYIVSAFTRKTAGAAWGFTVVVQSSTASPNTLEERIENWLELFRKELEEMPAEMIAMEANGMVAQLLEEDTKLSQEVSSVWGEIVTTETRNEKFSSPAFDRLDHLADELILGDSESDLDTTINGNVRKTPEMLKRRVIEFVDQYISKNAPERRLISSRVFSQAYKGEYESSLNEDGVLSSFSEMRYLKAFLSTWPIAPYWRDVKK